MASQKIENLLNLALDATPGEREKSLELDVGYDSAENEWDLIVKYSGSLERVKELAARVVELQNEYAIIKDRKIHPKDGSYTNYLFDKGLDKILKKVGEEATEIVIAAKNPDPEEIKYEAADFLYHLMVLMVEKGLTWEDITGELSQR